MQRMKLITREECEAELATISEKLGGLSPRKSRVSTSEMVEICTMYDSLTRRAIKSIVPDHLR